MAEDGGIVLPPTYFSIVVEAHGIMGSLAWIIFLPCAVIALRTLPSRRAFWAHVVLASLGIALIISNMGMGVWMAHFTGQINAYHAIIGLTIFSLAVLQPIWGWTQHSASPDSGRKFWGHLHVWLGRAIITLGIINGGLGLLLGGNGTKSENTAYGVVAGILWLAFIGSAVLYEFRRSKGLLHTPDDSTRSSLAASEAGEYDK